MLIMALCLTLTPNTASAAVKISKKNATMEIDSTLKIKISGTKSKVSWKSSKSAVASVSSDGAVTAKKEGQATVSATVDKKQYSCVIKVVDSSKKEVTAKKGTITELTTGKYLIGEDFPVGKYNVKAVSGMGNFFVDGNDTYVNEVMAEKDNEFYVNNYSYSNLRLYYGDEMNITLGVVLEFTKLD